MSDESLRDALASADAVIERVRASIIERTGIDPHTQPVPDSPALYEIERLRQENDDLLRELYADGLRIDAARRFRSAYPALARWRDRVTAAPKRASRGELAAAFEALAIEAVFAGLPDLAADAMHKARRAVGARVEAVSGSRTVSNREIVSNSPHGDVEEGAA